MRKMKKVFFWWRKFFWENSKNWMKGVLTHLKKIIFQLGFFNNYIGILEVQNVQNSVSERKSTAFQIFFVIDIFQGLLYEPYVYFSILKCFRSWFDYERVKVMWDNCSGVSKKSKILKLSKRNNTHNPAPSNPIGPKPMSLPTRINSKGTLYAEMSYRFGNR